MAADQLKLMKTNTEIILTGTQQQLDKVNIAHLEIGQASVLIVSSALRNLGSWFDLNLKMTEQINKTCQSVYYHLHNIRQIRKFLTPTSTKLLIQGVIMARIDYCNGLLYSVLAVILQRLQNSAARLFYITHTSSYCHITPVLLALHWGWWSSQFARFAIKSLWSLSRLFTVWGLRI